MKASEDIACQREGCGNIIPKEKLWKAGAKRRPKYCSRECAMEDIAEQRRATGFYKQFSKAGNAAQQAKAEKLGPVVHQNRIASLLQHRQQGRLKRKK